MRLVGYTRTSWTEQVQGTFASTDDQEAQLRAFAEKAGVPAAVAKRDGLFGDYSQAPADQKPNPKNAYPVPKAS